MMNDSAFLVQRCLRPAWRWLAFLLFAIHNAFLPVHAAFEFQAVGAHTAGAGDVGVALSSGAAGAFWNPAAVAWGKRLSAFAAYDRPFGMAELTMQALSAGVWPNLWPARIPTSEFGIGGARLANQRGCAKGSFSAQWREMQAASTHRFWDKEVR